MRLIINYCSHCGTQYDYCASGNGCFNKFNDKDLCPDCKRAVLEALEKIPVKYEYRWKEIEITDKLKNTFEEYKKRYNEEKKNNVCCNVVKCICPSYNVKRNVHEQYCIDNRTYLLSYDEKDHTDFELYQKYEYNLITNEFENPYIESTNYFDTWADHQEPFSEIPVRKLEPPAGTFLFMDYPHGGTKENKENDKKQAKSVWTLDWKYNKASETLLNNVK